MRKYKVIYVIAGWIEQVIVEARNAKEARAAAQRRGAANITKIERVK